MKRWKPSAAPIHLLLKTSSTMMTPPSTRAQAAIAMSWYAYFARWPPSTWKRRKPAPPVARRRSRSESSAEEPSCTTTSLTLTFAHRRFSAKIARRCPPRASAALCRSSPPPKMSQAKSGSPRRRVRAMVMKDFPAARPISPMPPDTPALFCSVDTRCMKKALSKPRNPCMLPHSRTKNMTSLLGWSIRRCARHSPPSPRPAAQSGRAHGSGTGTPCAREALHWSTRKRGPGGLTSSSR
mmetsp:Transcript_68507/g.193246  ORF Transcript_68507/g.193246 Transcript_68507/m.193246 type:complete len:239 (-) Transcript_68507:81-797(-)